MSSKTIFNHQQGKDFTGFPSQPKAVSLS